MLKTKFSDLMIYYQLHMHIKRPSYSANADHDITDFKFHEILKNKVACLKLVVTKKLMTSTYFKQVV